MKKIEVDNALYQYLLSQTQEFGETASDVLRRLLHLSPEHQSLETSVPFSVESAVQNTFPLDENGTNQARSHQGDKTTKSKKVSPKEIDKLEQNVRAVLLSPAFLQESKVVIRFLSILRVLYRTNPESFALATENTHGRTRIYFARDEATLLAAGNHTKPKQIPESPFWVVTNNNTPRKMLILENIMRDMFLPNSIIEEVRTHFTVN